MSGDIRSWSFLERPGLLLVTSFITAQLIATVISASETWKLAGIRSIGWGWTGVIWLYSIATYLLLDPIKFAVLLCIKWKGLESGGKPKNCTYQPERFWKGSSRSSMERLRGEQT
ncbi:Plasma membrane ATPase [Quillaja saponaria]|uniref:Plasma membrane ATPase n=1 Tax=Quillaja saponaria TaxID=32244 RepID=A0AAD7PCR2_QUISA|nr:Plasma membrane ATPase [Quillaja saponaria]